MAKGLGVIGYLMVGIKMFIVGVVGTVILVVPATLLFGLAMFGGSEGAVLGTGLQMLMMAFALLLSGFLANKIWKWK